MAEQAKGTPPEEPKPAAEKVAKRAAAPKRMDLWESFMLILRPEKNPRRRR